MILALFVAVDGSFLFYEVTYEKGGSMLQELLIPI